MVLQLPPDAMRELPDGTVEISLPSNFEAAGMARDCVTSRCLHLGDEAIEDVALIVSELVTNAVLHGRPGIELSFKVGPLSVDVTVIDHGGGEPIRRTPADVAGLGFGRGLMIVDRLAAAWGFDPLETGAGKAVWASVDHT